MWEPFEVLARPAPGRDAPTRSWVATCSDCYLSVTFDVPVSYTARHVPLGSHTCGTGDTARTRRWHALRNHHDPDVA